jgi:hypothetical protein
MTRHSVGVAADTPRSRADRLDPDGKFRREADGLATLARGLGWFLRAAGVDKDALRAARTIPAELRSLLEGLESAATTLAALGWIPFEYSPQEAYMEAARLVEAGKIDEAEEVIVGRWNENDAISLRLSVHRVRCLYRVATAEYHDPDEPDIGHARAVLINEAIENHRDGRFASAISIALAQIDGIVCDFSAEAQPFFNRDRKTGAPRATIVDADTLAGHPEALAALHRLLTQKCPTTEMSGRLLRHGIMHGRELGFGNLRNSTQALAILLTVITWAHPIAQRRLDAAAAERERRWAGSTERDAHGRLMDRRGFARAKDSVETLARLQENLCGRDGRYAQSIATIDPNGVLREMFAGADTACTIDGAGYIVWAVAETGYVFAHSNREGRDYGWQYAGHGVPTEPGPGDGWHSVLDEPTHPDW